MRKRLVIPITGILLFLGAFGIGKLDKLRTFGCSARGLYSDAKENKFIDPKGLIAHCECLAHMPNRESCRTYKSITKDQISDLNIFSWDESTTIP
tara:strand:- start:202 stop:486 length:285 start_codon:yes stop_codon:yes gene_type:complete